MDEIEFSYKRKYRPGSGGNGLILGQPGSGKTYLAQKEIIDVLKNTNDEVYVIDTTGEYCHLLKSVKGQEIAIDYRNNFINPMDMDINYTDFNPIPLKSDFISALCEAIIGDKFENMMLQKTITARCVRKLYERYMEHMQSLKEEGITCDMSMSPTLSDLYDELTRQPEPEAQNIALSLELYTVGSLDTFSHKTNVELNNRFVVFNIKDLGSNMQEMGLKITLNYVWNKMIENRKKGKRTWFYIDEFYLMTKTESSATFLKEIWKRARKWRGVPTGITQNIEDILMSEQARSIISNSEFVMMLSQAQFDRNELAHIFNLSESEVDYITEKGHGVGLLYTGKTTIPFMDKFPTNTKLFQAMTTTDADKKPKEEKRMTFNKKENEKSKEIEKNEDEKQKITTNNEQKQDIN